MLRLATIALLTVASTCGFSSTASATPICEGVYTTGAVPISVGPVCVPYSSGTTCLTGNEGLSPTLVVHHLICVPSLLAP